MKRLILSMLALSFVGCGDSDGNSRRDPPLSPLSKVQSDQFHGLIKAVSRIEVATQAFQPEVFRQLQTQRADTGRPVRPGADAVADQMRQVLTRDCQVARKVPTQDDPLNGSVRVNGRRCPVVYEKVVNGSYKASASSLSMTLNSNESYRVLAPDFQSLNEVSDYALAGRIQLNFTRANGADAVNVSGSGRLTGRVKTTNYGVLEAYVRTSAEMRTSTRQDGLMEGRDSTAYGLRLPDGAWAEFRIDSFFSGSQVTFKYYINNKEVSPESLIGPPSDDSGSAGPGPVAP